MIEVTVSQTTQNIRRVVTDALVNARETVRTPPKDIVILFQKVDLAKIAWQAIPLKQPAGSTSIYKEELDGAHSSRQYSLVGFKVPRRFAGFLPDAMLGKDFAHTPLKKYLSSLGISQIKWVKDNVFLATR